MSERPVHQYISRKHACFAAHDRNNRVDNFESVENEESFKELQCNMSSDGMKINFEEIKVENDPIAEIEENSSQDSMSILCKIEIEPTSEESEEEFKGTNWWKKTRQLHLDTIKYQVANPELRPTLWNWC